MFLNMLAFMLPGCVMTFQTAQWQAWRGTTCSAIFACTFAAVFSGYWVGLMCIQTFRFGFILHQAVLLKPHLLMFLYKGMIYKKVNVLVQDYIQ